MIPCLDVWVHECMHVCAHGLVLGCMDTLAALIGEWPLGLLVFGSDLVVGRVPWYLEA